MKYELTVVVPCYNESGNINELVQRLLKVFEKKQIVGQIVFVNDGSKDKTGEIIDDLARNWSTIIALHHSKNRGIEGAWKTGVDRAEGSYVCLIDADLQNLPEDVARLYREIKFTHADLVQGFRSSVGRIQDSRYILSKGLNFLLNFCFGMRQRDNKSGFLIALKETVQDILSHRLNYNCYQTFIAVAAHSKGYRIREIETLFESRLLGKSFIPTFPVRLIAHCLWDIAKGLWEFRLSPKRDNTLSDFLSQNPPQSEKNESLNWWRKWWLRLFFWTMPLHKWMITRQAGLYYQELKRSQWLSLSQIRLLQELKLRRLVHHAYHHVGYYRQKMDEMGLGPSDIQKLEDLHKLPYLEKNAVRENLYFDLLSDNHNKRKILKVSTSGSTGEPFVCFADQHQLEIRWASTLRSQEWTGYRFGDRQARLWHQTLGMNFIQVARERIDAWFNRRLFIPAFELSEKKIQKFYRKLIRFRPVLIDGYAESFNFLAQYLSHADSGNLRPKAIMSSAQVLPKQSRAIMEKHFCCDVFDKYGSREFSGIAYECEQHKGHHVVAESYIVEVLKDGRPAKPGEVGEIFITDLNNYCLPLIRYRVGDLCVAMDNEVPCDCGRGLPRIGDIKGRVQSIILGTNGNYIPGTFFAHFFKDYDFMVRQYKVIQEKEGAIQLMILKAPRYEEAEFEKMLSSLRKYVGKDMKITVDFVLGIPMVRTGKQQGSISKLKFDFQQMNIQDLSKTPKGI
ncbi:MAG: glycosyltransferase [Deltaproteobacteria bacterium]|nr:glycosyltransferase [Deltaproteobacteria bacterium]